MARSKEETGAWQSRLHDEFHPWPLLNALDRSETEHREGIVQAGYGFLTLMRAYQEFALFTFKEIQSHATTLDVWNIALNVAAMRRFRVAWYAYLAGYYFGGGSALRSVFEITMYLSVVHKGHWGFDELARIQESQLGDWRAQKKALEQHHRKLNTEVKKKVYGEESGLSPIERESMERVLSVLHLHVHRGESDVLYEVPEMVQTQHIPKMVQQPNLEKASIFCNVAVLIAWSHVRVLRFLSSLPFSAVWNKKYDVLDRSLREYIEPWENREASSVFVKLIETSFSFKERVAK